jgi:hypothetical protein
MRGKHSHIGIGVLLVLATALSVFFSGCAFKTRVPGGIGVPSRVSHIEFWNGGACIGAYDDAAVVIKIDTAEKLFGRDISFYRYEVTAGGVTDVIIDSEALAIKYRR